MFILHIECLFRNKNYLFRGTEQQKTRGVLLAQSTSCTRLEGIECTHSRCPPSGILSLGHYHEPRNRSLTGRSQSTLLARNFDVTLILLPIRPVIDCPHESSKFRVSSPYRDFMYYNGLPPKSTIGVSPQLLS